MYVLWHVLFYLSRGDICGLRVLACFDPLVA